MKKSTLKISLFASLSNFRINLVGQFLGAEVIAILFFPVSKIKNIYREIPLLSKVALGYIILLSALIVSDLIINNTTPNNYLRGWASVLFSYISVVFLTSQLVSNSKNINYYLLGAAVSFFLFGQDIDQNIMDSGQTNIFKIYFMTGTNFLILLVGALAYKNNKKLPLAIFLIYGLFSLVFDARSNGLVFFLSFFILFIKVYSIRLTKVRLILIGAIMLVIISVSYVIYVNSVLNGTLTGDNTKQIQKLENPYNPISLLMLGRADFVVTSEAIKENPVWGKGSWAMDKTGKYTRLLEIVSETSGSFDRGIIPTHSILLTSWLWAGIGGFIGALVIFILIFGKAWSVFRYSSATSSLIILVPMTLEHLWHFLFSPFGHLRTTVPFFIAIVIVEYYKMKKNGYYLKNV